MNRIGFMGSEDIQRQQYHEMKFERDHWKERADIEYAKKLCYKLLFLIAAGYIVGKWWLV